MPAWYEPSRRKRNRAAFDRAKNQSAAMTGPALPGPVPPGLFWTLDSISSDALNMSIYVDISINIRYTVVGKYFMT